MAEISSPKQTLVPKFTSFRPRTSQPSTDSSAHNISHVGSSDDDNEELPKAKRHRSSRQATSPRGHRTKHERDDHRIRKHSRSRNPVPEEQGATQLEITPWDNKPDLYTVDKHGDEENLRYGSLHRYNVPAYSRSGNGNVIGVSGYQKIDRSVSNEKYVVVAGQEGLQSTGRDMSAFGKLQGRETRIKPVLSTSDPFDNIQADFVPLAHNGSSDQKYPDALRQGDLYSSSDDESHHYRSIQGKAKPQNVPTDPDLDFNETSPGLKIGTRNISADEILLKNISLSRIVEAKPASGEAWQALIAHQDELLALNSAKRKATIAERLSNADIKMSMYEKALLKVQDALWKERLILGMMEEGRKLWDTRKLANKWQSVLKDYPHCLTLWAKYIDFEQTSLPTFRFRDMQETYARCLQLLRSASRDDPNGSFSSTQVYVLLRFTLCMRDAGFVEQSVAIWQGMLEFNFCRPTDSNLQAELSVPRKQLLDEFEKFWDSEVPRIGEDGSAGWASYTASQGQLPKQRVDKPLPHGSPDMLLQNWSQEENAGLLQGRQPARTIDDTAEDDPYRVVLFSDIKDYLLPLPSTGHQALVCAFLAYCGLPPLEGTPGQFLDWWKNPFIRTCGSHDFEVALKQPSSIPSGADLQHGNTHREPEDERLGPSVTFCVPSRDLLYSKPGSWFSPFDDWAHSTANNQGPVDATWVLRVMRSLVKADMKNSDLAEYLIALELHANVETGKKSAKFLVKRRSTVLRFYSAYAIAEYRLGRATSASKVLTTAINMSKTLNAEAQGETILLWQTLVWETLTNLGPDEALMRLLTIADNGVKPLAKGAATKPHIGDILRTQKALLSGRDHRISLLDYTRSVIYSEFLILLEYFTNPLPIEAALSLFEAQITLLNGRLAHNSQSHELLHQFRAKLLYYHTTHTHSFKPALVRSVLTESITLFPHNTIFLSLYALNETRFRIDDRVRSVVHDIVLTRHDSTGSEQESIVSYYFAIYAEVCRTGSNMHSIRGAFEHAMDSTCGRQSASLWRLYFLFEQSRGDIQKAKAVFYRAVRACPWCKYLYLLPFEYLREAVTVEELRGVYEMVEERELRVFLSLEQGAD